MDVLQATKGISVFIPMLFVMMGIALCIGFQFIIVGLYRRRDRMFLVFGLMSLIVALYIVSQTAVYQATTVAGMAEALRHRVVVGCIFIPLFFTFVSLYTYRRTLRLWLIPLSALSAVFLVLNLLSPYSLRLSEISEIKRVSFPWGETLNIYSGPPGKWNSFYVSLFLFIFAWAVWRAVVMLRAGERKRAWLLGAYCVLQLSAAVYDAIFIDGLGFRSFYTMEFLYFALVLIMSFHLSSELQSRTLASEKAITKLDKEITTRKRVEEENRKLIHELGERVKELTALHYTARILQHEMKSVPELLQEIVSLLPPAWQYPEITAARIRFAEMEFKTSNFVQTKWSQVAEFVAGGLSGTIEVIYLEARPAHDLGPFLLEEKNLINSLAEMLSSALSRKSAQQALRLSEERFAKAFQASPEPISIYRHRDGFLLEVNERWTAVYGYSRQEAVGRTSLELNLVKPEVRQGLRRFLEEQGSIRDFEIEFKTKQGDIRYINLSAEQLVINNEPCDIYLHRDITERKLADEQLLASREQLRALSERLRRAKEEEGIRIAREIHDELGSALTSLKWSLMRFDKVYSEAGNSLAHSNQREEIDEMVRLVDGTINTVRRIASELRPGVLDDLGLVAAIEWHAQQFQEHTGIVCRFDSSIENVDLNREQATTVFRIFQEAITNILRHAQATKVNVLIEEEEGEFVLEIRDNGRGILESEKSGTRSLGLLGMRERAHSVGGRIEINGITGKGTVIIVRLLVQDDTTF